MILQRIKILVVEDNPGDADLVKERLLEARGFRFDVALEGTLKSAVHRITTEHFDLVLLDLGLPDSQKNDTLSSIMRACAEIPIVVLTGQDDEEAGLAAVRHGAQDYLTKNSVNPSLLVRSVCYAIERKRTIRAMAALQEQLSAIINSTNDAIISVDDQQIITIFNAAAEKMFRCPADQAIGRPLDQFIPHDFRAAHSGGIREFAEEGVIARPMKARGRLTALRSDGQVFPVEAGLSQTIAGGRKMFTAVVRDVSDRERYEHELAKAKEDAEAANRAKSEFLANMSHEIRTPMAAIVGFAAMVLHKDQGKPARIEWANIIQRNALHLLEIINEILDLSKIEAKEMKVEHLACDLPALLSEIVTLMRPRAVDKGLGFAISFHGPIPSVIQTDPMRLRQILVNLLGNAMKFTDTGLVTLQIMDERAGGPNIALRVDVIDSGIGMTPKQVERLFQPFMQGDTSITRKFGGTGLGLTISQRFAQLLNGDISVASAIGVGSTFTLRIDGGPSSGVRMLPTLTEAELPKTLNDGDGVRANFQLGGRILLAEDGRDNQRLLRMQLTDAGAEVVIAENGQIAVDLATTQSFDLILMDMQMPVMDGYAATTELRCRGLTLPIIALTAHAMAEDRAKCMASGCSDYLTKPIAEELLLKTVNQNLGDRGRTPGESPGARIVDSNRAIVKTDDSSCIKSNFADNARMMKIIPEFVGGLPGDVRKMSDLLALKDFAALQRVVHQLRGACGGYGFDPVTEHAVKAEESIRARQPLESITGEVESLIEVIRRIDGYDIQAEKIAA